MNHIAATLLLSLAGKKVEKKAIEDIITSAGSKPNPVIIEAILAATKGKTPEQIIKDGLPKLSAATSGAVASTSSAPVEAKKEEKKDDKKDAKKDEISFIDSSKYLLH